MILARSHIEDRSERGHILVCAPSNAAVDEIVFRIAKRGLISYSGKKKPADILRIGAFDYEPPKLVKERTLDFLVEQVLKKHNLAVDKRLMSEYKARAEMLDRIMASLKDKREEERAMRDAKKLFKKEEDGISRISSKCSGLAQSVTRCKVSSRFLSRGMLKKISDSRVRLMSTSRS